MERLFCYFIFIGYATAIWGRQILQDSSLYSALEKEKKENITDLANKSYFAGERMDSGKKGEGSPFVFQERRKLQTSKQKSDRLKTRGLSSFEQKPLRNRKRNLPHPLLPPYLNNRINIYRYADSAKKYLIPPHSQQLFPSKNYNRKPFYNGISTNNILTKDNNLRPPQFHKKNNSITDQSFSEEASEIFKIFQRHPNEARSPRFHHQRHNSKICNSCNNSPWIPLIKVPHSYREERNQHFEIHKPHLNFEHIDHDPAPSISTPDFLLPPASVFPSPQIILDGTISSSFGLPVGNIPMSHGMLAPLNHLATKFNRYGANSIDYSNSLSYFNPHNILNNNNAFPELSPVPIVPIYDSGQFQSATFFDTPITKLLPPTTKTLAVSNVILTFSEGNPGHLKPFNHGSSDASFNPNSEAIADLHPPPPQINQKPSPSQHQRDPNENSDGLEIIKSVPVAEFSSSSNYIPSPQSQNPSQNFQSSFQSHDPLLSSKNHNHYQNIDSSENNLNDKTIPDNASNYLVPPPLDHFYNSSLNEIFPPYPPKNSENEFQNHLHSSPSESKPLAVNPTTTWSFSDNEVNVSPTAHPLLAESQAIASVVNSQLYSELSKPFPITSEAQSFDESKSKKIQIIIPYTTKNKNEVDHNAVESIRYEVLQSPSDISTKQTNIPKDLTFTTSTPLIHQIFQSENISSIHGNTFTQNMDSFNYKTIKPNQEKEERNEDHSYLTEAQHIIASNVRQLLLNEVEKAKSVQNFSLQKNIDNWTALEYSNHKVYESKQPQKIITQALAVTTIPGISMSHLLLPSKKIPSEYFATTASPVYEDASNFLYDIINSTVNSSPFTTRPYASTNLYSPLTTVTKETTKNYHQPNENQSLTTLNYDNNHKQNYTIVGKSRVSTWSKLNENLVVPLALTSTRRFEATTSPVFTNKIPQESIKTEKVDVVTPVYWSSTNNFTVTPYRRTTRHLTTTARLSTSSENPKTKYSRPAVSPFKSLLRPTLLKTLNSTKLEKVSKNKNFTETLSNNTTRWDNKTEGIKPGKSENFNETIAVPKSWSSFNISPVVVASTLLRNVSSEEVIKLLKTNKSEEFSINDIFPFRNQELPWESSSLNASNLTYQNERQRKSLIKQTKLRKPKTAT